MSLETSIDKYTDDDVNVLIMGETGVGKSSWINSIAMYLRYESFDKAKNGELINLIPTDFGHTNEEGEEIRVKVGQDDSENENLEPGQSHTMKPKSYLFEHKGHIYRIIDTPGIADTRGIDYDKKNVQEIIKYISDLPHINLIVFLLQPNQSRLTTAFEFCFTELIMHFHRSAAKNIVFAFTKSAGCDFELAGTKEPLKLLLKKIKDCQNIVIPLNKNTKYFFDNCSYEYFCVKSFVVSTKVNLTKTREKLFKRSYEMSRGETLRLFEHAKNIEPHNPQTTAFLNYTRNVILQLSGPLAMISASAQRTMENIHEREKMLKKYEGEENELEKRLYYPITIVKYRMEKKEKVKCRNCAQLEIYEGDARLPYIEADPSLNDKDHIKMWVGGDCEKNASGEYECPKCGLDFKKFITTKTFYRFEEEKKRKDDVVNGEIVNSRKRKRELEKIIAKETCFKKEIIKERDMIIEASAKIAAYLKASSIVPYNDVTNDYLRILIEVEKKKNGVHSEYYKNLCKMLEEYHEQKEILDNNVDTDNNDEGITSEQIQTVVAQLCGLKNYGISIRSALQAVLDGYKSDTEKYGYHFVHTPKPPSLFAYVKAKVGSLIRKWF